MRVVKGLYAWFAGVSLGMATTLASQTPVVRDGLPAVECTENNYHTIRGVSALTISRVALPGGEYGLRVPVFHVTTVNGQNAYLILSEQRIALESPTANNNFDLPRSDLTWKETLIGRYTEVDSKDRHYNLMFLVAGNSRTEPVLNKHYYKPCQQLAQTALSDFPAAYQQFLELTKRLPPMLDENFHDFQPKAAAWRALNPKPPLPADADREWLLAENAVKERDLGRAIEHYRTALKIQPAWPTGWFDLAMVYGEKQDYAGAADAMRYYLELVPDAADAKSAREQMYIWEDKAKQ